MAKRDMNEPTASKITTVQLQVNAIGIAFD